MTDNEIIKAFKDFLIEQVDGYTDHVETGGERYEFIEKELELLKETDNLINRLQAKFDEAEDTIQFADKELKKANTEIERLKNCVKSEDEVRAIAKRTMEPLVKEITREQIDIAVKLAKAEAYKEFAERLKENSIATFSWNGVVLVEEIDNLLKEMVGDNCGV